jgi:hypothetical protein
MKILGTLFSLPLLLLGAIFVLSAFAQEAVAQGKMVPRLLVGGIMVAGAGLLLMLAWWPRGSRGAGSAGGGIVGPGGQEAPGQLSLKALTCPHCGGQVSAASAKLNAEGTLSVTCDYCKGVFLVQEDPKW